MPTDATSVAELRQVLAAYERERALRLLARLRGLEPGPPDREQRQRAAFLLGDEPKQVLADDTSTDTSKGVLLASERAHLDGHLGVVEARARLVRSQGQLRDALWESGEGDDGDGPSPSEAIERLALVDDARERRRLARAVVRRLSDPVRRRADAWQTAHEQATHGVVAVPEDTREQAGAFLADTQDAADEHVRFACRSWSKGPRRSWDTLVRALRFEALDAGCPARERSRRLARSLHILGFERHLGTHVRVEAYSAARAGFRPLVLNPPLDLRIGRDVRSGVLPDLRARETLGTALGWSLVGTGLPFEMRMPLGPGPGPLLGGLLSAWAGDPGYQARVHGLRGASAEPLTRAFALAVLLRARIAAARVAADLQGRSVAEVLELRAAALSRALSCEVPPTLAALLWTGSRRELWDAQGRLLGLALHVGLRERFDEDCFRNPRTGEALRDLCAAGNLQEPHGYLAALGVPPDAAQKRILELLP